MPRKIDANWGCEDMVTKDWRALSDDEFAFIVEPLGQVRDLEGLRRDLADIACDHTAWAQQGSISRASERKQLRAVANCARNLIVNPADRHLARRLSAMIGGMSGNPSIRLQHFIRTLRPVTPFNDPPVDYIDDLEFVPRAAELAISAARGPLRPNTVVLTTHRLMTLYRAMTGRPATHSPYREATYTGRPQSSAGRHIVAFFKVVDPDVTETVLNTIITAHIRATNRATHRSPAQAEQTI